MPRVMYGRVAFIESSNAEVRLLRGEFDVVTVQICVNRRCVEAKVDPRDVHKALYSIAADALGEDVTDVLERALEALWAQLLVLRASFNRLLEEGGGRRGDLESVAARLVVHWDVYTMLNDILALLKSGAPREACRDTKCIEAAKEVSRRIDERLGADKNLKKWLPRRR